MAATLTSTILVRIQSLLESALDLTTLQAPHNVKQEVSFATGTGAGQADKIFSDTRTITQTAGSESLDLQGSLLDPLGAAFTPAKIRALYIHASSGNTADVIIGNVAAAVPIFGNTTGSYAICPDGVFCLIDPTGIPVTATTGDIIKIANGLTDQGTVGYDIVIIGTSA